MKCEHQECRHQWFAIRSVRRGVPMDKDYEEGRQIQCGNCEEIKILWGDWAVRPPAEEAE